MANLIDKTYFIGEISLPSQVLDGDYANIDTYIARYEKEVLLDLLGYDLYKDMIADPSATKWAAFIAGAEYTVDDYTVKWNGLTNTNKISLIAYYIYFHYMRDFVTSTTNTGEVLSNNENANKVTPSDKMANAWNRFLELYGKITDGSLEPSAYRYLVEKESDFDLWVFKTKQSINSFDI